MLQGLTQQQVDLPEWDCEKEMDWARDDAEALEMVVKVHMAKKY